MLNILIIILALILLCGLLYFEKGENQTGRLSTKIPLSALFIIAAMIQPHPLASFFYLMLIGLICCMAGDICLVFPQKAMFLTGLVAFLVGHIWYTVAFFHTSTIHQLAWIGFLVVLLAGGWIYFWLRPHLGSMKLPVLLYIIFISLMVGGAWTVLGDGGLSLSGRLMVIVGALLFYFSDLFVARQRFVQKVNRNRLIGLPLYYFGQYLLAFSTGILK
jgi:uncharacterized membrane protein YhhN